MDTCSPNYLKRGIEQMENDLEAITKKIIQFKDMWDWGQYHDRKNHSQALT